MKVEVKERGAEHAAHTIAALGTRAADIRPVERGFERIVGQSNARRFQTRGGGTWAELSPETARQKSGDRLLVDSGELARSLARPHAHAEGNDKLIIGFDVKYARFHQYGTQYMPKRKLSELRSSEKREVAKLVERYVGKGRT